MKNNNKISEEEKEYNYIKSINIELKVSSIQDYVDKKSIHMNYVEDPEKYFRNNGVWRNWYDFMGTDTSIFISNKEEWIKFCKEKNIKNSIEYNENCKIYKELPLYPDIFYKGFTNILYELNITRPRRK